MAFCDTLLGDLCGVVCWGTGTCLVGDGVGLLCTCGLGAATGAGPDGTGLAGDVSVGNGA